MAENFVGSVPSWHLCRRQEDTTVVLGEVLACASHRYVSLSGADLKSFGEKIGEMD